MLDSPAAIIAQHGSTNCPLAGQGAITSRTAPSTAARSLWPTIQHFAVLSASRKHFMAFLRKISCAREDSSSECEIAWSTLRPVSGIRFDVQYALPPGAVQPPASSASEPGCEYWTQRLMRS